MKASRMMIGIGAVLAVAGLAFAGPAAAEKTRVVIGATSNLASYNPYADSAAQMYSVWCNVYGCLCRYNFEKADYEPLLAESWEVDEANRNIWTFHLRKDVKSQSGAPLTAHDVKHSIQRINTDKQSAQRSNTRPIARVEVADEHTVRFITKKPTAPLLQYVCDLYAITRKAVFEEHGAREADRKYPDGFGPYRLVDMVIGERIVLEKKPNHPMVGKNNPDILIWRKMQEVEQRVTALLNGEIQIAQYIPPHLMKRIADHPGTKLSAKESVEMMFLAMNPTMKPWDNKKLRRAVAYAIDRQSIVDNVLNGMARVLHGPVAPGQIGYDPEWEKKFRIPYDPEKAKRLVREAGYPNGVDVDLYTAVGRYVNDKQVAEALVPMLARAGIRTRLHTPEYATQWANVRKGKVPFYYQGRGSMVDPSAAISQYFETGVTPRIGYSNPALNAKLRAEREEFDPQKRKQLLNEAFAILMEDMPALFMWQHKLVDGLARNVDYTPAPNNRVYGDLITVHAN